MGNSIVTPAQVELILKIVHFLGFSFPSSSDVVLEVKLILNVKLINQLFTILEVTLQVRKP